MNDLDHVLAAFERVRTMPVIDNSSHFLLSLICAELAAEVGERDRIRTRKHEQSDSLIDP